MRKLAEEKEKRVALENDINQRQSHFSNKLTELRKDNKQLISSSFDLQNKFKESLNVIKDLKVKESSLSRNKREAKGDISSSWDDRHQNTIDETLKNTKNKPYPNFDEIVRSDNTLPKNTPDLPQNYSSMITGVIGVSPINKEHTPTYYGSQEQKSLMTSNDRNRQLIPNSRKDQDIVSQDSQSRSRSLSQGTGVSKRIRSLIGPANKTKIYSLPTDENNQENNLYQMKSSPSAGFKNHPFDTNQDISE